MRFDGSLQWKAAEAWASRSRSVERLVVGAIYRGWFSRNYRQILAFDGDDVLWRDDRRSGRCRKRIFIGQVIRPVF